MGNKRYKVIMSNCKQDIIIRENELPKVLEGIGSKSIIVVKEAIINPSFLIAIVADYEREKVVKQGYSEPSPFAKLISGEIGGLKKLE